jgi:hypothetical protein|eukprot:COSAG03_NODE_222_length_10374_cov_5.932360_2_plen_178_part_00
MLQYSPCNSCPSGARQRDREKAPGPPDRHQRRQAAPTGGSGGEGGCGWLARSNGQCCAMRWAGELLNVIEVLLPTQRGGSRSRRRYRRKTVLHFVSTGYFRTWAPTSRLRLASSHPTHLRDLILGASASYHCQGSTARLPSSSVGCCRCTGLQGSPAAQAADARCETAFRVFSALDG